MFVWDRVELGVLVEVGVEESVLLEDLVAVLLGVSVEV